MKTARIPKNIAILSHPIIAEASSESELVANYLIQHGVKAVTGNLDDHGLNAGLANGDFDLAIVLGGDGTILRAGHLCISSGTPILGINFGRFGFLMEIQRKNWRDYLPRVLEGDFRIEERMLLVTEHWRKNDKLASWVVLNESVVCRGQLVRPLHLDAYVDGHFLTTYVADGLIASTPTGSTAYALAAGGPIMPPELRNILLVPVAPHLSVDRAVILSQGARVSIEVMSDHPAVLSVDGQAPITIEKHDRVDSYASDANLLFVRFQNAGYFYRTLMSHMDQNPSTGITR